MRLDGTFTLEVVQGGLSPEPAAPVSTLEERVREVVEDQSFDLHVWEAVAYVRAFERSLGREMDRCEVVESLAAVEGIQSSYESLKAVLVGRETMWPMDGGPVFTVTDGEFHEETRVRYERQAERNRRLWFDSKAGCPLLSREVWAT